jgi:hypothetical protein
VLAVTLTQGRDELFVPLASIRMEPLLELIQDKQELPDRRRRSPPAESGQCVDEIQIRWEIGTCLADAP